MPLLVAISGPHGAGKSRLAVEVGRALRDRGLETSTAYLYGCVICRRAPANLRDLALRRDAQPAARSRPGPLRRAAYAAHALIDVAEIAVRIGWMRVTRGGRVIITDRGPVDGIAKHGLESPSVAESAYRRLARGFDATFVLDAPAPLLRSRVETDGRQRLGGLVGTVTESEANASFEFVRRRYDDTLVRLGCAERLDMQGLSLDEATAIVVGRIEVLLGRRGAAPR
ncbi:MAG TPA: hypothetical protein VEW95_02860 [Candidatus Limnocylindrales bacterium]|nr:hypothetical protein [Candidatus Limnocylindrales bacterium]